MPYGNIATRLFQKKALAKRILLILPLFFFSCSYHQNTQKSPQLSCIQITDRHGITETISSPEKLRRLSSTDFMQPQPYHQVIQVFQKDPQGKTPGTILAYYPNGQISQSVQTQDGRALGEYRSWYSDGTPKIHAYVLGGPADLSEESQAKWLFDGISSFWDEKGNLLARIPYEKGLLHGESLHYYPHGSLKKIIPYEKGRIEGKVCKFSPDNQLIQETSYIHDQKHGKSICFWKPSVAQYEENYSKGLLEEGKYFDQNRTLIAAIEAREGKKAVFRDLYLHKLISYHQGIPDGKVEIFTPQKELKKIYHIKNGKKQGEEILFYLSSELVRPSENRQPKLSFFWDQDSICGTAMTWYNNGQIESQKQMTHNQKNGSSSSWYRNGKVMCIEEYQMGNLLSGSYFSPSQLTPVSSVVDGFGAATIYDGEGVFIRKIIYVHGKPEKTAP
ncbi:MAG: hypothetical protein JW769_03410 [Parachlamydiales bacterium]|nr:hypothetical protein [Parachlamydiales bacterium]